MDFLDENNSKNRIFRVAAHLFAERGYNGVSMREISETTGLSKPTIYYYFGNKEGIYSSLVDAGLHFGSSEFQNLLEQDLSIRQKIIEIAKIRFRQVLQFPEFAKFFLRLYTSTEKLPFLENFIKEAGVRRQLLIRLIEEGVTRGEFGTSANPQLAAEIFMGAMMHFILNQLNSKEMLLSDKLAEDIVELLFKGLNE
ncbi:MAG: TetR/AcrR family transcriptional regulator [Calditrichia bacterium]